MSMTELKMSARNQEAGVETMTASPKSHQQAVEAWNERNPVGTKVSVFREAMRDLETKTDGPAFVSNRGKIAKISVDGIMGPIDLSRVTSRP